MRTCAQRERARLAGVKRKGGEDEVRSWPRGMRRWQYLNGTIILDASHLSPLCMRRSAIWAALSLPLVAFATACRQQTPQASRAGDSLSAGLGNRLPMGVRLDPAAPQAPVGPMPLT